MKRITSIVCSLALAAFGVCIALVPNNNSYTGYKTATASTMTYTMPTIDMSTVQIPKDLSLDLAKKKASDTVYITKTDTVMKQVTKVKWRKVAVPTPVVQKETDTVYIPKYYLATQSGVKEEPAGCTLIYEVQQIDKICPENINSSANTQVSVPGVEPGKSGSH